MKWNFFHKQHSTTKGKQRRLEFELTYIFQVITANKWVHRRNTSILNWSIMTCDINPQVHHGPTFYEALCMGLLRHKSATNNRRILTGKMTGWYNKATSRNGSKARGNTEERNPSIT
jgi:hypothetical protein